MYDWHQYNEKLVRRGEILISGDCFKNWNKELAQMNCGKQGRRFPFPESFMKLVAHYGTITKVLADATYDSKNNFSFLYHNDIITAIKVRKNSSGRSGGCYQVYPVCVLECYLLVVKWSEE